MRLLASLCFLQVFGGFCLFPQVFLRFLQVVVCFLLVSLRFLQVSSCCLLVFLVFSVLFLVWPLFFLVFRYFFVFYFIFPLSVSVLPPEDNRADLGENPIYKAGDQRERYMVPRLNPCHPQKG